MSVELFNENFIYDSETGIVYRKLKTNQNTPKQVGTIADSGYMFVVLNRKEYQLHRVAYAMFYGVMPDYLIEHINGIKTDNRISNLRLKDRSKYKFYCDHCGNRVIKLLDGHEKKRIEKGLKIPVYCNSECKINHRIKKSEPIKLKIKVNKEICALKRIGKYKETPAKYCKVSIFLCSVCNKYIVTKHSFRRPKLVHESCRIVSKQKYKQSDRYKVLKRIYKAKRKALKYDVEYERFNPELVFDRDGWRCQMCLVSTPKSRRGKIYDNSPELDHIIPISKGGKHTMSNTQCLCRKCNGIKSNKIIAGQMGLFTTMALGV